MLERIKSLKTGTVINMYNPCAQDIYNLDSINLIIGNNGKGKTTLIKSIIRDLIAADSPTEFIADGITEQLGIIYYTATPFHIPITHSSRSKVKFLDASTFLHEKQNFVESALEYLAISKILKLEKNLRSVQHFDILERCFEYAILITPTRLVKEGDEEIVSPALFKACSLYRKANHEYYVTKRSRLSSNESAEILLERESNDSMGIVNEGLAFNLRTEHLARAVIDAKEKVAQIFLQNIGLLSSEELINWISTEIFLRNERVDKQEKRQLAFKIYRKEFGRLDKDSRIHRGIFSYKKKVQDFIDLLERTNSGTLKFRKKQIELTVNTATLIKESAASRVIETAHKLGLVKIGFDNMSSGQAAIMHQMISISHSIEELKTAGKKEILIFIDEGDLLLHLNWQRQYISLIDNRLSNFKKGKNKLDSIQVVIASHSPLLASDILRDSITKLDDGIRLPSFGAPIQQIVNYSFDTPSIGLVAQNVINELKAKQNFTENDIKIIKQIDDDFIREILLRKAAL